MMWRLLLVLLSFYGVAQAHRLHAFRWVRCVENWLTHRKWTSCQHLGLVDTHTPVHAGGVSVIYEMHCAFCGIVLLRDAMPSVEFKPVRPEQLARKQHWADRREYVRLWVVRWVLPVLQEARRFCAYVGGVVLLFGLVLWLWGPPLQSLVDDICPAVTTTEERMLP